MLSLSLAHRSYKIKQQSDVPNDCSLWSSDESKIHSDVHLYLWLHNSPLENFTPENALKVFILHAWEFKTIRLYFI